MLTITLIAAGGVAFIAAIGWCVYALYFETWAPTYFAFKRKEFVSPEAQAAQRHALKAWRCTTFDRRCEAAYRADGRL